MSKPDTKECDYLVFDLNALIHRSFFSLKNEPEDTIFGLAVHAGLNTMNRLYKMYRPRKGLIIAGDRRSWRKDYTASEACLSQRPYKGNRNQDMTPTEKKRYQSFIEHAQAFEDLLVNYTNVMTLFCNKLEADDLIAGVCQHPAYANEIIIVASTDSDLFQLMSNPNVTVVSPKTEQPLTLEKYQNDPLRYIFHKIFRGDSTDNIRSAFPRIRGVKLDAAYEDPFKLTEILKERWVDERGVEVLVEDAYYENKLLIDLSYQPDNIRKKIFETIDAERIRPRRLSMMQLMQFCRKHQLIEIGKNISNYLPMFSK